MKNTDLLKNKKIFIFGLGKSGISSCRLCHQLGAEVTAYDSAQLKGTDLEKEWEETSISLFYEVDPLPLLEDDFDFMIKSPGISYDHPLIKKAEEIDLPILTDVELAYHLSEAPIIGITGTNGKTTVTTLITEIINQSDELGHAYISGNIGVPVCDVVQHIHSDEFLVMELSSFQLMGVQHFHPAIALIINLYAAHLDYHHSREEYVQAKFKLLEHLDGSDCFVYNGKQDELIQVAQSCPAKPYSFANEDLESCRTFIKKGVIYFDGQPVIAVEDILLAGDHNLENVCAAITVCKLLGVSNASIQKVLSTFSGVKHRLQALPPYQGRRFYNDSKATNVLASQQALSSFDDPVIWLAGGLDRHEDLTPLLPLIQKHVKAMVVSGENQQDFIDLVKDCKDITVQQVENMAEAVQQAYQLSSESDVILLSPASASWDQYPSFEARGEAFIQAVEELRR